MNKFEGVLGMQVDALMEGIANDLEKRRIEMREKAERDAASLLRRVRARSRSHARNAVADERRQLERALQKARAAEATTSRQVLQRQEWELIREGTARLRDCLTDRWANAETRAAWIETLLYEAQKVLEPGCWTVEHPEDTGAGELDGVREAVEKIAGETPHMVGEPEVTAGLRIRCGGAALDMSLSGLLARDTKVDGLLLAEIHRLADDLSDGRTEP